MNENGWGLLFTCLSVCTRMAKLSVIHPYAFCNQLAYCFFAAINTIYSTPTTPS